MRENSLAVAVETFYVAAVDDHFLYAIREVAVELISVRKLVVYTFAINFHGFCSVNVASHAAFSLPTHLAASDSHKASYLLFVALSLSKNST